MVFFNIVECALMREWRCLLTDTRAIIHGVVCGGPAKEKEELGLATLNWTSLLN